MERLGEWIIEERIGSGGLADVYRAVPADGQGKAVALKVLREPERSVAHRKRFLREGRLLGRLSHAGLPRCMDAVDGPQPYLVLELLHGRTLSERIKASAQLDPNSVGVIATSLLRVLALLHQSGIVHRDVKSSNIYLAEDRRVLLLDLGLAADPTDPLTTTLGDVMGTYAYMAPEQLSGANVDHRCDLYSLGVTLYEALCGSRPYQARGAAGYLQASREGDPAPLAELCADAPARLLDLVSRLMQRDPAARPSSAGVALALFTGSGGARRELEAPPLVGRAAPMGAIQAVLDGGGSVAVTGEIGSGTTMMASWALSTARKEGFETIALRCSPRGPPEDLLAMLARDLAKLVGPVPGDLMSLGRALDDLAAEGPLLLVIEGVEHLASTTAQRLAEVLRRAPRLACVLFGVRKPDGIAAHEVQLRLLTVSEVNQLVRGMLNTFTPPTSLTVHLHRISGGLPAIVVLAVKELVARQALWFEGVSDDGSSSWRLDRAVPLMPTTGLVQLFGEVLASLSPMSRALLELMALAGEHLPEELVLQGAEADHTGVELGPLLAAGLASKEWREDTDWVGLRRPALGTLVLRQVSAERQVRLHLRLVEALSSLPPSRWRSERMAWHRAHGKDGREAPAALLDLAERLVESRQHNTALDVLSWASSRHEPAPDVMARLALLRGECLDALGRRHEATEALNAARRLAEDLDDEGLLARALIGLASAYQGLGVEPRAASLVEEALDILDLRPADPALPRALLLAGENRHAAARPDEAADLFHRCIDLASSQHRPLYAAIAHGSLGTMLVEEGGLVDGILQIEEQLEFFQRGDYVREQIEALVRLAIYRVRMGRLDQFLEALARAEELAAGEDLPFARCNVKIGRAVGSLALGDTSQAAADLRQARAAIDPDASSALRLRYRILQLELRLRNRDHQAALATCQQAEVEAARAGFKAVGAWFLGVMGVLTADAEALTHAMDVLSQGGDRRQTALLLLLGATVGGDAEVLRSAEEEARASNDLFVLLEVLHASGRPEHHREASALCARLRLHLPVTLREVFQQMPSVRWADQVHRG